MKKNQLLQNFTSKNPFQGFKLNLHKLTRPITDFNKKTKLLTIGILIILFVIPILIFYYLDLNSTRLGIDIFPDYVIPNHTLTNIGLIVFTGLAVFLINTLVYIFITFYMFGLQLSFKQDLKIFYKFTLVPNIVLYYGVMTLFIGVRRIPYYVGHFDTLLIFSLILFGAAFILSIFNSIRWIRYIKKLKGVNHHDSKTSMRF